MDENVNYECALQAIDTSVTLLDLSTISNTLRRFPVLQVRASQLLITEIGNLSNASEKSRLVPTIADAIGCIVSPYGLLTTEGKLCATTLYYGIRDRDEHLLQLIINRMLEMKRNCFGCGLFAQIALSETLQLSCNLLEYVKRSCRSDDAYQFESEIQPWKKVMDLLQREGFLKRSEQSPDANLKAVSGAKREKKHRLCLRMQRQNKIYKKSTRKVTVPFRRNSSVARSHHERQLLLKLVTLYAAYPDAVAEKIRANGIASYCAAKIMWLHDSLSSSERCQFTDDELRGMKAIAGANMTPMSSSYASEKDVDPARPAGTGGLLHGYKIWMPLAVGIERFIHDVQNGHYGIDSVCQLWTSANGTCLSSVDQIIVAGLSHEGISENLLKRLLFGERRACSGKQMNGISDTQDSSVFGTVRECFRMLNEASLRGTGYPTIFWEQCAKVFEVIEGAMISLVLHDVEERCVADMKKVMIYIKNIAERLRERVEYRPARPRTTTAAVKVCDCLSVEMEWKDKRRLRVSLWRGCDCMKPKTVFLSVPRPDLWFSYMSGMDRDLGNESRRWNRAISISRWLYGNPSWRNRQYNFSTLEVFQGIVKGMLRGSCPKGVSEGADMLRHVLKNVAIRTTSFSVFAECSHALVSEIETRSDVKLLQCRLEQIRVGIENVWSTVGHGAKAPLFHIEAAISSEELGHIESMLTTVAPCSKDLHDCIRDMPAFCEYVASMHRLSMVREGMGCHCWTRIRIIAGLMSSQLSRKAVSTSDSQRQNSVRETVMLCFE